MATQNPIELEGTFPLPEAQLDRFLLRVRLGYPDREEELAIMDRFQQDDPLNSLQAVATPEQVNHLRQARKAIVVSRPVKEYIADIVKTDPRLSSVAPGGESPARRSACLRAGQSLAALRGRAYVLPDDIKLLAPPVLAHRLVLGEADRLRGETHSQMAEKLLQEIIAALPVPGASQSDVGARA